MTPSTFAYLDDRAVIRVSGPDAHTFLQNLVSADIDDIDAKGAGSAALLTPQGKILFDFLIFKSGDSYLLDAAAETAADLLKRLTFYRLRAKVDLELLDSEAAVFAVWGGTPTTDSALVNQSDPRLADLGHRVIGPRETVEAELGNDSVGVPAYDAYRIGLGVPEGLKDYDYSDIFPLDADLDQLAGVSFTKGCYVGQEVVSRMHHKGTARKRFVQLEGNTPFPARGANIMAGDKSVGVIGSSAQQQDGYIALALVRLDKISLAKDNDDPLTCGDTQVQVRIPEWADFPLAQ